MRHSRIQLLPLLTIFVALAHMAFAQTPPASVAEGHKLAATLCTQCHVIVANGPASWTDAPSFQAIANRRDATVSGLADFIMKPHMEMLPHKYTRPQAEAMAAYILSLRAK